MRVRRALSGSALTFFVVTINASPALAHEEQVIQSGSFFGGLLHPVLGLDHFLAMVAVGIVSAFIGGRAIWTVPLTFVLMMAVGGVAGANDIGFTFGYVELAIAVSVIALGAVIALDISLQTPTAMAAVVFFGFFHGYAHGLEIPLIANPIVYALGFLVGTVLIHLLGVVIGVISDRNPAGRVALRIVGATFVVVGLLFIGGVL